MGERDRLPTPVFLGFPCGSAGKESACSEGNLGLEDTLEKGKATHSSILAGRIPWTIQSLGSQRVWQDFQFHLGLLIFGVFVFRNLVVFL